MLNFLTKLKGKVLALFAVSAVLMAFSTTATAQCTIEFTGAPCVDNVMNFEVTGLPAGAVDFTWDIPGVGISNSKTPSPKFPSSGSKDVEVIVKNASGVELCRVTRTININKSPVVDYDLVSADSQCFKGNEFCFVNKSTGGESGSDVIEVQWLSEDGGFQLYSSALGDNPMDDWCHKVIDKTGGTFSITLRVTDDNGCITTKTISDAFTVYADLGLDFFTDAPVKCGKTCATFTNNSAIQLSDVKTYTWNFGNGVSKTDSGWNGLVYCYTDNGVFDASLVVESNFDCADTFVFKSAAENVKLDLKIVPDKDSTCITEPEISFSQTPVISNKKVSLLWIFGDPDTGPLNVDDENWTTIHKYSKLKPFIVSLNVKVGSVCDSTVIDTVWVFGPQATIEIPGANANPGQILDKEKYQCVIKDTVHFVNNSSFFNNDQDLPFDWKNEVDPTDPDMALLPPADSVDYHVDRLWVFGDDFAPRCTTDSRLDSNNLGLAGINLWADSIDFIYYDCTGTPVPDSFDQAAWDSQKILMADWFNTSLNHNGLPVPIKKNCNFSKDELPAHWYRPWEEVCDSMWRCNRPFQTTNFNKATRQCTIVQIDTTQGELWKSLFYENVPQCKTVSLILKDTVHPFQCEHSATVSLALAPPDARKLKWEGILCTGNDNPNNGVHFNLEDTKPGCGQSFVWVNFDTLQNPKVWVGPNNGLLTPPLASPMPWMKPPAPSWPNQFVKKYGINDIFDKNTGWVSVGLIIGNGPSLPLDPECKDTFIYDSFFQIIPINATYRVVEEINDTLRVLAPEEIHYCEGEYTTTAINFPFQDSISTLTWNWGDNYITQEFRVRYRANPAMPGELMNYLLVREIDPNSNLSITDSIVTRRIITWDTVADITDAEEQLSAAFDQLGLYMREIDPADLPLYFGGASCGGPAVGCIDTCGYGSLIKYGIRPKNSIVTHYRDTMIGAFDTIHVPETYVDDGLGGKDTIPGFIQPLAHHQYNTAGQYIQSLTLRNTLSCQDQKGYIVLVGFDANINAKNTPVCIGQKVEFNQFVRYFSFDPINDGLHDPTKYWDDPNRALAGLETMKWDFDSSDDDPSNPPTIFGEFGPGQEHIYYEAGEYIVRVALKDSNDCVDTVQTKVYVTDLEAEFDINDLTPPGGCVNIIQFFDKSTIDDPCPPSVGPCDKIDSFWWDFGDPISGVANTSRLPNPGHNYERFGEFEVTLIVQSKLGCRDTIKKKVSFEGPDPAFEHTTLQICEGEEVALFNKSNDPDATAKWSWDWGDNSFNSSEFPDYPNDTQRHVYTNPGRYCLTLTESQTFFLPSGAPYQCKVTYPYGDSICVTVIGRKPSDFDASDDTVCPNDVITFTDKSDTAYTTWKWNFGDGTTGSGKTVTHSYSTSGTYNVVLCPEYQDTTPFTPECPTCDSMKIVVESIKADFEIDSLKKPFFNFTNTSTNAVQYRWTFLNSWDVAGSQDLGTWPTFIESSKENPCEGGGAPIGDIPCTGKGMNFINYQGQFYVCLEATNINGCSDTICKVITQNFFSIIRPHNVFTPGDDNGLNDVFDIEIEGEEQYELVIYNRWGVKVFESTDKENDWNGKVMNTGAECPEGTYFWTLDYRLGGRDADRMSGTVTLIRK